MTPRTPGSVSGSPLSSGEGAPSRHDPDRTCGHDGCATRLSIYNDAGFCSLHEPMATPRLRGRAAEV